MKNYIRYQAAITIVVSYEEPYGICTYETADVIATDEKFRHKFRWLSKARNNPIEATNMMLQKQDTWIMRGFRRQRKMEKRLFTIGKTK